MPINNYDAYDDFIGAILNDDDRGDDDSTGSKYDDLKSAYDKLYFDRATEQYHKLLHKYTAEGGVHHHHNPDTEYHLVCTADCHNDFHPSIAYEFRTVYYGPRRHTHT